MRHFSTVSTCTYTKLRYFSLYSQEDSLTVLSLQYCLSTFFTITNNILNGIKRSEIDTVEAA